MTTLAPPMPTTRTFVQSVVRTSPATNDSTTPRHDSIGTADIFPLSVAQYQKMIRDGILAEGLPVELLDGILVSSMSRNPPHCSSVRRLNRWLFHHLPDGWVHSCQGAVTLDTSEPEPDLVVMKGTEEDYGQRHPSPADIGLVIEVSETTLSRDLGWKLQIYARNRIPVYWVINLIDRRIHVFSDPTGPADETTYRSRTDYETGATVPVFLNGVVITSIKADDVFV